MANGGGYVWALAAGFNAAISAKFFDTLLIKYGMVILFNVTMWGCYVNSLKALSSLQATVTNFAANFISSGLSQGISCFMSPCLLSGLQVPVLSFLACLSSANQVLRRNKTRIRRKKF